jgi:hypothetical protein
MNFRQPTPEILRRERPSWLTIAAAAIASGKSPGSAIHAADAFERQLWEEIQACPTIEGTNAAERARALLSIGIVEHDA